MEGTGANKGERVCILDRGLGMQKKARPKRDRLDVRAYS